MSRRRKKQFAQNVDNDVDDDVDVAVLRRFFVTQVTTRLLTQKESFRGKRQVRVYLLPDFFRTSHENDLKFQFTLTAMRTDGLADINSLI